MRHRLIRIVLGVAAAAAGSAPALAVPAATFYTQANSGNPGCAGQVGSASYGGEGTTVNGGATAYLNGATTTSTSSGIISGCGTADSTSNLTYYVQIGGTYDPTVTASLAVDLIAVANGTITSNSETSFSSVFADANITVAGYFTDRAKYVSYAPDFNEPTRNLTEILSVHPGQLLTVYVRTQVSVSAGGQFPPGNTNGFAYADPRFYFTGTDYGLTFSDGIGNAAPILPGGVPEPATWAMLVMGFGAVGTALRARGGRWSVLRA